jgi:hypothetical protein
MKKFCGEEKKENKNPRLENADRQKEQSFA